MIVIETFEPGQAPSRHPPRAPPAAKAAGPPPSPLRAAGCPALADSQTDPIKMLQTTHQDLACRNRGRPGFPTDCSSQPETVLQEADAAGYRQSPSCSEPASISLKQSVETAGPSDRKSTRLHSSH